MFAPPVKAPKAKTALQAPPAHTSKPLQPRPVQPGLGSAEQLLALLRTIGNQAALGLLAQAESVTRDTSSGHQTRAPARGQVAGPGVPPVASWDFSKTPVFAPDLPNRHQTPSPFLQRKLAIGQVNDPLEHEADPAANRVMRNQALPQMSQTDAEEPEA